jgi:putative tricarboxylic transport membrane protein
MYALAPEEERQMNLSRRKHVLPWMLIGVMGAFSAPALAQWKPTRNVEIVVASAAGGPNDRTGRLVQKLLQAQPDFPSVTVVNKPGGAATIGAAYVNQQVGNPHVLLVVTPTLIANRIMGTTTISHADFTPLGILFREYIIVAVRADSPIRTAPDLLARVKADPMAASFAIASARGNHNHMVTSMLFRAAGANPRDAKIVVYNGSSLATTATLGGHIDVLVSPAFTVARHIEGGKLRALGATSPRRLNDALGTVPTLKEQGLDIEFFVWRGLVGPGKLSEAQVAFWDGTFAQMVQSEEWRADLSRNYLDGHFLGAAESRRHLDREHELTKSLLSELGLAK